MGNKKELLGLDGLNHGLYALSAMIVVSLLTPTPWKNTALAIAMVVQFAVWFSIEFYQAKKMNQGSDLRKWSLARRKDMIFPAMAYVSFYLGAVLKYHGVY